MERKWSIGDGISPFSLQTNNILVTRKDRVVKPSFKVGKQIVSTQGVQILGKTPTDLIFG